MQASPICRHGCFRSARRVRNWWPRNTARAKSFRSWPPTCDERLREEPTTPMTPGPLSGIRILEVGVMLAGPYATMLLADLGAEVIKIEPPGGEISRQVSDSYFASLNRNKQSVCLDLRSETGRQRLGELVTNSHALLVNMKPSAIKRLGL